MNFELGPYPAPARRGDALFSATTGRRLDPLAVTLGSTLSAAMCGCWVEDEVERFADPPGSGCDLRLLLQINDDQTGMS